MIDKKSTERVMKIFEDLIKNEV